MTRYSDPSDEASSREEAFLQDALEKARQPDFPSLPFTGRCHNCDATVDDPRRYCDEECADEHEYIRRRQHANRPTR